MKFENKFTVKAPAQSVWAALMDFERVVPCMPGAEVLERRGEDAYQVQVRVKVGPMSMMYRGTVEITERDEAARTAAMRVQARETRGQGTANATVDIALAQEGPATKATMTTDVRLSGRAASMGRGVVGDISQALIAEFAANLAELLAEERQGGEVRGAGARQAGDAGAPVDAPSESGRGAGAAESGRGAEAVGDSEAALDAGRLARTVISGRLRDPRTAFSALVAVASAAIGFLLGRSRR